MTFDEFNDQFRETDEEKRERRKAKREALADSVAPQSKPPAQLLDDNTVQQMLDNTGSVERRIGRPGELNEEAVADLCCHIKALACDRDTLRERILEECERVEKLNQLQASQRDEIRKLRDEVIPGPFYESLGNRCDAAESQLEKSREVVALQKETIRVLHDATIVLRNAISRSNCRLELYDATAEAQRMIERVSGNAIVAAFDAAGNTL